MYNTVFSYCIWFISVNVMLSSSIHVIHVVGFHPLYSWVAFWCVLTHITLIINSSDERYWGCFHFFALGTVVNIRKLITLQHTDLIYFGCLPSSWMLNDMMVLFFVIWEMTTQFFITVVLTFSQMFSFVYMLAKLLHFLLLFFVSFSVVVCFDNLVS